MKRSALLLLTALAAAGVQAQSFNDNARVRRVDPQYETVQMPREECTSQWVQDAPQPVGDGRNYGGLVIGGVAGGVLGNQVGKGHGREAATAVGAVVGALAGQHIANQAYGGQRYEQPAPREVRSCRTVNEVQQRPAGYRVEYEYRGQVYTTVTREHPGQTLPVRVSVAPAEREYHRY